MSDAGAFVAVTPTVAGQERNVLLQAVSRPELGDILIEESLFAIGRNEPPFATYDKEIVAELSRRHARVFWEGRELYVADLGSKNGTSVNGVAVGEKPSALRDGDEVCFGGVLSYRVRLVARAKKVQRAGTLLSLTLTPERDDLLLEPVVIASFPFLISKIDDIIARYKSAYPHQVNYISRRHAHIFLKGGAPFIEDLGSTNGTFVGGTRLDEHAVELHDGDVVAFGGDHFVYRVSLQHEAETETEPTVTGFTPAAAAAEDDPGNPDRTMFIAAPDSFLDIFCISPPPQPDEVNDETAQAGSPVPLARRERSRTLLFVRELGKAFAGGDRGTVKRMLRWGIPLVALLVAVAFGFYRAGSAERELGRLVAAGDFARAAAVADAYLASDPDDGALQALGTEALLKAKLPEWVGNLQVRAFDRAAALVADMKAQAAHNADAQPLLAELEWVGELERFVVERGGVDAPIRIYADEERIGTLLQRWHADTRARQRALARVAAHVPEFRDVHAEVLTHLRRLESDESVYLAAIERLNAGIAAELDAGRAETLDALLNDYAGKYPRLAGLDAVREDLRQFVELDRALQARRLEPLIALLEKLHFSTPPFRQHFARLGETRLPSGEVVRQHQAAARAWREGRGEEALAGLQQISAGPWAEVAAAELARKKTVLQQFGALQQARGGKGYDERLLAFHASLDESEDAYFIRATGADVAAYRDQALAHANGLLARAAAQWRQYRSAGGIGGEQRLESGISGTFRSQARLLAEAQSAARQGARIHKMLKTQMGEQAVAVQAEIDAEAELQRQSLQELHRVLEPGLLKAKLALIGGQSDEERKSP
ncbi:FHA domain-containing protein [Aromatoleum anaerobium]|uniref:FHA domain-containing protein n=1 Tax=Aromatoleum anaerobium TaxID=182180 RepID=UPI00145F1154|nr:FHA domain-containing protein [Aromatoleum anaerobium]MCK0509392.1 FHA domain-containing protein [Aromatoleum anaerobium]